MAIDTVTAHAPTTSDTEFKQAIKQLKEAYLKQGGKDKGKERAALGMGMPKAMPVADAAGGPGGNGEEDGDEMSIG
jgi:anaphase-promoting complex subunit 6